MKKVLPFVFVLCLLTLTAKISAQEDQQAMMKAWQEYMTPGPMHQMLSKSVGEWKSEIKIWMDPAAPPTTAEGTGVCEAILDGRYFQTKHTSSFMGMPFNGVELTGYDKARKKFFSTWIDNMGTGIMHLEGTYDEATKSTTLTGVVTDPMGKEISIREVIKYIDDDNLTMEMFSTMDGKEFKSMEMKITRVKS